MFRNQEQHSRVGPLGAIWSSSSASSSSGGGGCRPGTLFGGTATSSSSKSQRQQQSDSATMSDAELAKEMTELSVKEREQVLEDIHGVAPDREETPEFTSSALTQFDIELHRIPKTKKKSLEKAFFLRPSLAMDTKFKLMFLRADQYEPKKAAYRMVAYFKNKHTLFGDDLLARKIRYNHLSQEDITFFEQGSIIELPQRDQTSRPIWFVDISTCDWNNPVSLFRCSWYLMMSTIQGDEIAQKRGICQVVYHNHSDNTNNNNNNNDDDDDDDMDVVEEQSQSSQSSTSAKLNISQIFSTILKSGDIFNSLPIRVTSSHQCFENNNPNAHPHLKKLLSAMRIAFGKELRLRMKVHFGTSLEIEYALLTFGIRRSGSSSTTSRSNNSNKNINNKNRQQQQQLTNIQLFQEYKQRRLTIENAQHQQEKEKVLMEQESNAAPSTTITAKIIAVPNPNDVLIGRGRPYHEYSGNILFTRIVDSLVDQYEACGDDHFAKTCLTLQVIKSIQEEHGGRFLLRQSIPANNTNTVDGSGVVGAADPSTTKSKSSSRSGEGATKYKSNIANITSGYSNGWILADNALARQKAASAFRSKIIAKSSSNSKSNNNQNAMPLSSPSDHHLYQYQQDQKANKRPRYLL